jgi:hypothetical protein
MKSMVSSRYTSRVVSLLLFAIAVLTIAGPANAAEPEIVRSAFLLGFYYGNAHNVYSQNLSLSGDARSIYDSWMSDASEQAQRLDVALDTFPPPVDKSSSSARYDAIRAGRRLRAVVSIKLMGKYGGQAAAALELGYVGALAFEYLPFLTSEYQQKDVEEFRQLAAKMELPESIVNNYTNALIASKDRKQNVLAMLDFKKAVVRHYEGLQIATTKGARNQLYIWRMGWKLGLATLGQTRGASPDIVDGMFEESRAFAEALGIRIPTLPEASTDSARDTAQAFHFLLSQAGEFVNPQLESRYGPRASALFELSIKSTLAMLLYGSDDEMGQTLRNVVERSGRKAGLPSHIYEPLVRKMSARAPYPTVKQEIIALNDRIIVHYGSDQRGQSQPGSTDQPSQPGDTSGLTDYTDPNGMFSMVVPRSWTVKRQEGWSTGHANTYLRETMFAPQDAHLADINSYLSEGILVTFYQPPEGQEWTMSKLSEWAPIKIKELIEANPGFVTTSSTSVTLGGQPAMEYQMVGENANIPEPEKSFFIMVANERYRLVVNIVSPTSKLEFFNNLRQVVLENFKIK